MKRPRLTEVTRYGCAVLAVGLATVGRLALDPVLGDRFPFATLFLAVLIVAAYGGLGPALLATALGAAASAHYLLAPRPSLITHGIEDQVGLVLYVAISLGIAGLGGALRAARRRAERHAAAALRQKDQLRATLTSIGDGVIVVDGQGRLDLMNRVAEKLTGWAQAEAAGRPVADVFRVIDEATRRPFEGPAVRALREGAVAGLGDHSLLLGNDGIERAIDNNAAPIRDESGAVRGAVLVFRDVTARRRDEAQIRRLNAELHERVRELETLLDILPVGVWVGDPACERIVGNRTAYEMLRLPVGQNVAPSTAEARAGRGPGIRPLVDGREIPPDQLPLQRAARTGRPVFNYEHDIVLDDGTLKSLVCNAAPVVNGDGIVRGVLGAYADITERKRAEDALQRTAEQLRIVTDSMAALVTRCGRDLTYRWVSQPYADWIGRPARAIVGQAIADILGPEAFERLRPRFEEVLTGRVVRYEEQIAFQGIGPRWLSAVYTPTLDADGVPDGWVAAITDVTERKRMEMALREADRRKDEFLATLAHELRNPLAPIRNAAQVLKTNHLADPDLIWARDVVDRQVTQMARLLDDLLDVSRITRNKLELRKAQVTLAEVVDSAVETSLPVIAGAGHELAVSLPPEPVLLDADPVRLAQVFSNLLNNAARYTDRGGHIRLSARAGGGNIVVSVQDDGIGIAPDVLPRLFAVFSQATPALERSQGGLGIGLSLAKGLVELHGGTIAARSDGPGRGSEFVVRLPIATARQRERPPAGVKAACQAGCKIVVADDNRDSADSLTKVLRLMGHEVRTAYDGQEALERAEEFRPDLAVLDIGMPRLNGYETARHIRAQPWGKDMVVIALTGWGQDEDKRRSAKAGFDAHLVKPVDLDVLERLIGNVARRNRP